MRGSDNSNRVSLPSAVNLSQGKLPLTEDSPSRVGSSGTQGHLQRRVSSQEQQSGVGFEGINQPSNLRSENVSQIPLIEWKSPPKFMISSDWRVVAGEESSEREAQNERELRELEAIYPRPSAIPPNPIPLADDDSIYNDQNTPLVRITPIEDEESVPIGSAPVDSTPVAPQPLLSITPYIATVAKAALAVLTSNNFSTNLIDGELLGKILSNPKMVELLMKHNNASSTMPNVPTPPRPSTSVTSSSSSTQFNASHMGITPSNVPGPSQSLPIPVKKDINYYKSLIQQHGGGKQESLPQTGMSQEIKNLIQQHGEEREDSLPQFADQSNQQFGTGQVLLNVTQSKPKIKKPCIYFNTLRGCRNGANCLFQHSAQRVGGSSDVPSAKRVKLD